jgi:glycosyltransferase involved in cell wall biosynthesis
MADMTARHILIPIHDFNAGGTEAIAFRLAAAWIAAGRQVTVLAGASDGPMRARVPEGAAVHVLSPERRRSPLSRLFLGKPMAEAAKALRPDAIFIPGNFHFILAAAFKRALPEVPIIAKISNPLTSGQSAIERVTLRWWTRGIDLLSAMAPGFVADTRALLPDQAVRMIHDPFLDDDTSMPVRTAERASDAPLKLLAIGRLEPQKNMRLAIDALAELRRTRPATLTILGDGRQRQQLESHVQARGLGDSVAMAGFVGEVLPYIDESDVLLISSRYEGGPAVAIEALARGVPFASTDCSQMLREIAREQPSLGILAKGKGACALADAVAAVADRPLPRRDAIEAYVARHRMAASAAQYLACFDSFCAGRVIPGQ